MRAMEKIKNKNGGFSLIEVLFAMMFMSVIIFGVIKLQTSNLTLSNTKQLELKAHSYAAQGLQIADALGAEAVTSCSATCYFKNDSGYSIVPNPTEQLEEGLFERSFTHSEDGLDNATLVTMTVNWEDSVGNHRISAKRIILN